MRVRLTHLDGELPNLALMKLAHYHRAQGDEIVFTRNAARDFFEPEYDRVYGSAIFTRSRVLVDRLVRDFPDAIVGGTGTLEYRAYTPETFPTVERIIGVDSYEHLDYSIYPDYRPSLGFTQRGCRLKCGFCGVPQWEGKNRAAATIAQIFRGDPHPRLLHLLDNDFFGQDAASWHAAIDAILDGGFRVCLNQGINVRLVTSDEIAQQIARLPYYDDDFKKRRLYTAWDNLGDEKIFFRGVDRLEAAGVPASHLMVYVLVGFDDKEVLSDVFRRLDRLIAIGAKPYVMPYDDGHRDWDEPRLRELKRLQRWVNGMFYQFIPFNEYRTVGSAERLRIQRLVRECELQIEMFAS